MPYATFSDLLSAATAKARAVSPNAQLYEADGSAPSGASSFGQLNAWRFVYFVPDSGNAQNDIRTILVNYVPAVGAFTVQTSPQSWMEDRVIDPSTIKLSLEEAIALVQQKGTTGPFKAVTLRWPLYPFASNGFWFFGYGNNLYYAVDYVTGSVSKVS